MSNETALVPYQQLDSMADAFAKSGMFGAKNKEQALSLLLLAQAEGVHPAIAMRDFDIIQGRPAKKSEAMHRAFIAAGGSIKWHQLDDKMADATFSHQQGGEVRISWDMERAKKAGLQGKDMYTKYPRQMLKARCISEGVRTVYPAATSGLYVPEEVRHFDAKPQPEKDMGDAEIVMATPEQIEAMRTALKETGVELAALLEKAEITDLTEMPSADVTKAIAWIKKNAVKK